MRRSMAGGATADILASCIVCVCIELWHGDVVMARQHALAGLTMAQSMSASEPHHGQAEAGILVSTQILPILFRVCEQMGLTVDERRECRYGATHPEFTEMKQPLNFSNSSGALCSFRILLDLAMIRLKNDMLVENIEQEFQYLLNHFNRWYDWLVALSKSADQKTSVKVASSAF